MNVVLIGYRGCGKTTVGRLLADRLWRKFIDLDERIVTEAGASIAEIFERHGEGHFRDLESRALVEALATADAVVSAGGGAVMREENRRLLKDSGAKVIYLRCDPRELERRIEADPKSGANRPSLTSAGGGIEEIRKVLAEREPVYREMMTGELDVTSLTPADAVVHISRMV